MKTYRYQIFITQFQSCVPIVNDVQDKEIVYVPEKS